MLQAPLHRIAFEPSHVDVAGFVSIESRRANGKAHPERRAAPRHGEDRLRWIRVARLQFGHGVSLVDLSTGGARLNSRVALRPSYVSNLEIIGAGLETVVQFRVLRCEVAGLTAQGVIYRGACQFIRPIDLSDIGRPPVHPAQSDDVLELDVVLKNLVRRASGEGGIERFSDSQLVQALTALQLRAANVVSDPMGRQLNALLRLALPALEEGSGLTAILPAIEMQLGRVVPGAAVRFAATAAAGGAFDQNSILIGTPGLLVGAPLVSIDVPKRLTLTTWQLRVTRATARVIAILQRLEPDRSIDVASNMPHAAGQPEVAPAPAALSDDTATAAWQKVVVRYSDGKILKGYTCDFLASREDFTLYSAPSRIADDAVIVPFMRLKAVFFVRDFAGNPGYVECNETVAPDRGRRIEVTLNDEEVIVGTTLNYRSGGQGFFVTPIDPQANNIRVFVVAQSVRQVRFPPRPAAAM